MTSAPAVASPTPGQTSTHLDRARHVRWVLRTLATAGAREVGAVLPTTIGARDRHRAGSHRRQAVGAGTTGRGSSDAHLGPAAPQLLPVAAADREVGVLAPAAHPQPDLPDRRGPGTTSAHATSGARS